MPATARLSARPVSYKKATIQMLAQITLQVKVSYAPVAVKFVSYAPVAVKLVSYAPLLLSLYHTPRCC